MMRDFRGAALVQRKGKDVVLWEQGLADGMIASSCSPATRFQIASVSKQFMAAAILLLVDRGVLSVDDMRLIIMSNDQCTDIDTAADELLRTVFSE